MVPVGLRPLRHRRFRWLWVAGVLSFFGTWIHNVAARWTAATLTTSPFLVSLVDALQALPIVLLSLWAGRLADTVDRRRLLVAINLSLVVVAASAGLLAAVDLLRLPVLFALTALMGVFVALDNPAWQATVPRQVPDEDVHGSVALVSTGYNAARTLGPTVGAWLLVTSNAATAFLVDAATFAVMALLAWRLLPPGERGRDRVKPPPLRTTPQLRRLYAVALLFSLFAMPSMSLLPIVARDSVEGGALAFGGLLSAFGVGAVLAGFFVAGTAQRIGYNRFVAACSLISAAGLVLLSLGLPVALALLAAALCGAGWLGAISITNSTVNTSSPAEQRGRVLAVYFVFAFAGQFGGSLLGGFAAERIGLGPALLVCAALLVAVAAGVARMTAVEL